MKAATLTFVALCMLACSRAPSRDEVVTTAGTGAGTSAGTSAGAGAGAERLVVGLDRNGVVIIGARKFLLDDEILGALGAFHEHAPRGKIVIRAHRATLHGRLVRIVDLAKEAKVAFEIVIEE